MRKIIDSRGFDTDKARLVAEWDNGLPEDDAAHFAERLYRKNTGEYFLYGQGGPDSRYAKKGEGPKAGTFASGDDIIPLTRSQAKAWGEKHMKRDEVAAEFVETDADKLVNLQFRLTAEERERLRFYALSRGISISALIREYIDSLPGMESY